MEHEKHSADDEGQAFLIDEKSDGAQRPGIQEPGMKRQAMVGRLRLGVEIAMLGFIGFLLAAKPYCGHDTIRRSPVPRREFHITAKQEELPC